MPKVILVGEVNPYGVDPQFALYHLPRHASGNRLREHLGLSDVEYEKLEKVNLCVGQWSMKKARERASVLLTIRDVVIVMLGVKVRTAFDSVLPPFAFGERNDGEVTLVSLPHPSGMNRAWNRPESRRLARKVMRVLAPSISWGS